MPGVEFVAKNFNGSMPTRNVEPEKNHLFDPHTTETDVIVTDVSHTLAVITRLVRMSVVKLFGDEFRKLCKIDSSSAQQFIRLRTRRTWLQMTMYTLKWRRHWHSFRSTRNNNVLLVFCALQLWNVNGCVRLRIGLHTVRKLLVWSTRSFNQSSILCCVYVWFVIDYASVFGGVHQHAVSLNKWIIHIGGQRSTEKCE